MLSRLNIYTVHMKLRDGKPSEQIAFVPEGFSFWPFAFTGLWALYHKCWLLFAILIALNVSVAMAGEYLGLGEASALFLQMGIGVWAGFHGNDYRRAKLKKQGYILTDLVSGENQMRAEQRYFDRHAHLLAAIA